MQKEPRVGVGAVVFKENKILLGKRRGAHGDGCWQLPGGHLEWFETVADCAARELYEETGLVAQNMSQGPWADAIFSHEQRHYITVFMLIHEFSGTLSLNEPEKCEGWNWFDFEQLPRPLFLPLEQLTKKFNLHTLQSNCLIEKI